MKAGEAIVQHPKISCISFTGGTLTGKKIMEKAAPFIKTISLELGGKNAAIIFEDALRYAEEEGFDLADIVSRSSFFNQGEVCLCASRIFVHRSIYEEFKQRFLEKVRKIKVGDPFDPETSMGPLVSKDHWLKVDGYIKMAEAEGGRVLHPSKKPYSQAATDSKANSSEGFFMQPTVIEGLQGKSACMQQEIFGPVVCLSSFESEEEGSFS